MLLCYLAISNSNLELQLPWTLYAENNDRTIRDWGRIVKYCLAALLMKTPFASIRTSIPYQKQCNVQLLFSVILLANWYINFWAILQKFECFVQFCLTVQFTIYQSIACAYHTFCCYKKSRKKHLNFCCVPNSQFCHTKYDKKASFSRNAHIVGTIANHNDFKHVMSTSSN